MSKYPCLNHVSMYHPFIRPCLHECIDVFFYSCLYPYTCSKWMLSAARESLQSSWHLRLKDASRHCLFLYFLNTTKVFRRKGSVTPAPCKCAYVFMSSCICMFRFLLEPIFQVDAGRCRVEVSLPQTRLDASSVHPYMHACMDAFMYSSIHVFTYTHIRRGCSVLKGKSLRYSWHLLLKDSRRRWLFL